MSDDRKKLIERLGGFEMERFEAILELLEPKLVEICDEMRALKAAQEKAAASSDGLLKKNELATMLQVSISTVNKMQSAGMPFVKCLNAVRFDYAEVREWLRANGKKSEDQRLRMVA